MVGLRPQNCRKIEPENYRKGSYNFELNFLTILSEATKKRERDLKDLDRFERFLADRRLQKGRNETNNETDE